MELRYTKSSTINGKPVTIHAISTGYVAVKKKYRDTNLTGILGILNFLFAKEFTEWMPIWVWVIEHEEGVFIIDTGENSNVNDKDYFKPAGWFNNWFNTTQFKFKVEREDEIDAQLKMVGLSIEAVKTVILTHRHLDHVDGLKYFQHAETLVHRIENEKPFGDLPHLYPDWFEPTLVDLEEPFHSFSKTKILTSDGAMRLIHTPGHTYGHCSISLETDEGLIFFAADISYNQDMLIQNQHAGADVEPKKSVETYQKVKDFARAVPIVYLPSHDSRAGERLMKMEVLKV